MGERLVRVKYDHPNADKLIEGAITSSFNGRPIQIVCIGTDRSTGDSLGPLVGTMLEDMGYNVLGTLESPVHAANLVQRVSQEVHRDNLVVAVDACLGPLDEVGNIFVQKGSLKPGAGVNKNLPEVGHVSIKGTVNVGGYMEYVVLQNTRLSLVFSMARIITRGIASALDSGVAVTE